MISMLVRVAGHLSAVVFWMLLVSSGTASGQQVDGPARNDGSGFMQPNLVDRHPLWPFGNRYMSIDVYGAAQNQSTDDTSEHVYLYEPPLRFRIADDGMIDVRRSTSDPRRVVFYLEGMNPLIEERIWELLNAEGTKVLARNVRPLQYTFITLSDDSGQWRSRYPETPGLLPVPQDWIRFVVDFTGQEDGSRLADEFVNRLKTEEVEFNVVLGYGGREIVRNTVELTTRRLLDTSFHADLTGDGKFSYVSRNQIRQALAAARTEIQQRVYLEDPNATVPSLEWPESIWESERVSWDVFLSRYEAEVSKYGFHTDDLTPDTFTRFLEHVKSEMEDETKDHIDIQASMAAKAGFLGIGGGVDGSAQVKKDEFARRMRNNENRVEWDGEVFRPRTIDLYVMDASALDNEDRIASYVITTRPGAAEPLAYTISSRQGRSAAGPTGGGFPLVADTGQEVCTGPPNGADVFSVGEVRTSILKPAPFQELNGSEWALMDGRLLSMQTALSPHLSEETEYGPKKIPDARGRFLRMANNDACSDLRDDDAAYSRCIADHDPGGDNRLLGTYQADAFRAHQHVYNDVYWSEGSNWLRNTQRLPSGATVVDLHDDGLYNGLGSAQVPDKNNDGIGFDRSTKDAGRSKETRSKNIAVNYYIKICNCRTGNCR